MPQAKNSPVKAVALVCQVKITLIGSQPPIWRRVLVAGDTRLDRLHGIFQKAMGWRDCHLHMFEAGEARYAPPTPDWDEMEDESAATLRDIAPKAGSSFIYVYDMGDGWRHEVEVEAIESRTHGFEGPRCAAGARACPPEDCGGIDGYEEFLEAICNPRHKRHDEMRDWIDGDFNPEKFDLVVVNRRLSRLGTIHRYYQP